MKRPRFISPHFGGYLFGIAYQNADKTIPHQNPIRLNAKGAVLLYGADINEVRDINNNVVNLPLDDGYCYFVDKYGKPLANGKVYTYFYQSTVPKESFDNNGGLNTNPVILDDDGKAQINMDGNYRLRVYDKYGVCMGDDDSRDGEITNTSNPPPSDGETDELTPTPIIIPVQPREQVKYVYLSNNFTKNNANPLYFDIVNGRQSLDDDYLITDSLVSAVKSKLQISGLKEQTLKILEFLNAESSRKLNFFGANKNFDFSFGIESDTMQIMFDDEYSVDISSYIEGSPFFNKIKKKAKFNFDDINQYKNLTNAYDWTLSDAFEKAMKTYVRDKTINLDTIESGEIYEKYYNGLDSIFFTKRARQIDGMSIIIRPVVYTTGEIIGKKFTRGGEPVIPILADKKKTLTYSPNFESYLRSIGKDAELVEPVQTVQLSLWEVSHITDDYTQLIYKEHLWGNS